ncbi:MAG TPA: pilus assembly PilX N-terminal domain-containing protein [Terriglobia bacterium]|nr:pilus assembly PilX N-terminal domain-containing protein [Terriglobia bacterium]
MVVKRDGEFGIGLILALMILAVLSMLIGAMLTAATVEMWIGNNFRTESRLVYLTEAGIEDGRDMIRLDSVEPSPMPFIERTLRDTSGRPAGNYAVTLVRSSPLTLRSAGEIGSARKTIEVRLKKSGFPALSQAITLNEDVPSPPGADLNEPAPLEGLVEGIRRHADEVHSPPPATVVRLGTIGSASDYRVVVVDGNAAIGDAGGHGLLVVRGELELQGTVFWNGLIVVVGQGVLRASASSVVSISGAVFLSRTREDDRSETNPLGTLLPRRGPVTLDLSAVTTTIAWSAQEQELANRRFPFIPITWREY